MRILIVSQYYSPESVPIPPTLAGGLVARGHEVRVLTAYPNYPEGRLYRGHRQRWRTREADHDVEILRVPLWIDHSQRAWRRLLNYATFGLSASTAFGFARGVDVVYVYATQMTPALGPWLWRAIGGAPYVLHVMDLWPDSLTASSLVKAGGAARIVESSLKPWLASVYRHAAAVIGVAPTMLRTLVVRGVSSSKAHLVYNWADEQPLSRPDLGLSLPSQEGTTILYLGNVGDMQDLETAVHAAHRSEDAGVRLKVVGDGVALPRVQALAQRLRATNVTFLGRVNRDGVGRHYLESDFALVSLKDLPVFRGTIPSKFQTALSYGTPVISTVQGDLRALVEGLSVGLTADAEDADSLESAFRRAAALEGQKREDMAERARCAYISNFSLDAGVAAIDDILQIASRTHDRGPRDNHTNGDARAVRRRFGVTTIGGTAPVGSTTAVKLPRRGAPEAADTQPEDL